MDTATALQTLRVKFGSSTTGCTALSEGGWCLNVAAPLLDGQADEVLFEHPDGVMREQGHFRLIETEHALAGVAVFPYDGAPEEAAQTLYRDLLERVGGRSLYRVWNFVPGINDETDGLENYRSFNVGRFRAFKDRFGEKAMEGQLPAASGVGVDDNSLAIVFLAGNDPVSFFENPQQVPAYHYPAEYGPRSPSFARGAVVNYGDHRVGYLSGTSSIRGYETIGEGDLDEQFAVTMDNVSCVLKTMDFASAMDPCSGSATAWRIYVRDPGDMERVRELFYQQLGKEVADRTLILQADICRHLLKLEIEGIFVA